MVVVWGEALVAKSGVDESMRAAAVLALCLAAARRRGTGDLDRSFGRGGLVYTNVAGTDFGAGGTLLPDRRILA
jgi:hypothetical protein